MVSSEVARAVVESWVDDYFIAIPDFWNWGRLHFDSRDFVYLAIETETEIVKLGWSRDPIGRLSQLSKHEPLVVVRDFGRDNEQSLHALVREQWQFVNCYGNIDSERYVKNSPVTALAYRLRNAADATLLPISVPVRRRSVA